MWVYGGRIDRPAFGVTFGVTSGDARSGPCGTRFIFLALDLALGLSNDGSWVSAATLRSAPSGKPHGRRVAPQAAAWSSAAHSGPA